MAVSLRDYLFHEEPGITLFLCTCNECGRLNYVEPSGEIADCQCGPNRSHTYIPWPQRNTAGTHMTMTPRGWKP